jgi:hypothetical protein
MKKILIVILLIIYGSSLACERLNYLPMPKTLKCTQAN